MAYALAFHPQALDEWHKLDASVAQQFKKNLAERLEQPAVASARVSGGPDLYKVKLRTVGYRLVYQVHNQRLTVLVLVLAVGRRERNAACDAALDRQGGL